jgi:DNA-binding MarR family transcriptional regulator
MHALFFGLKRAYQAPLNTFNRRLRAVSLTCARYDLLHALRSRIGRLQSELWKILGVARPVVCRMLKALEKMGLVRRRVAEDRRQRFVELTPRPRRLLGSSTFAQWILEDVEIAMDTAVGDRCVWDRDWRLRRFDRVAHLLDGVRNTFGDCAFLEYDWFDDFDPDADDSAGLRADDRRTRGWRGRVYGHAVAAAPLGGVEGFVG